MFIVIGHVAFVPPLLERVDTYFVVLLVFFTTYLKGNKSVRKTSLSQCEFFISMWMLKIMELLL